MRRSRVLFISHSGAIAGSEQCLVDLLGAFDPSIVEPAVLAPQDGPLVARLEARGIPVAIVPFDRWLARRNGWPLFVGRAARTAAMLPALMVAARRARPDVIYTNSAVVPVGAILARLLGKPHVWHVRELVRDDPGLDTPLGRSRALRLIGLGSDAIIAVSESVRSQFPMPARLGVQVIGDGVDVAALKQTTAATDVFRPGAWPRLVAVAAMLPQKGIEDLITVAEALLPRWPRMELAIVGDGPHRAQFERLRSRRGLDGAVTFSGHVSDAPAAMRAATLTLSASHIESFGRVLLESVTVGTPVVATDTGAASSVLGNGAGVVVPIRAPQEMAAAVDRVLRDERRLDSMREATAEAASRFDIRPIASQVEDVIRRVCIAR